MKLMRRTIAASAVQYGSHFERVRKIAPAKVQVPQLKSVGDHMLRQLMQDLDDLLLRKGCVSNRTNN